MSFFGGPKAQAKQTPAISGMQIQTSAYGVCLPLVYGRNRSAPNLIWYGDFQAHAHHEDSPSGGKGGGESSGSTSYTYTTALILAVAEGPISSFQRVWAGKDVNTVEAAGFSVYGGNVPEAPWGWLASYAPDQAIAYHGTAHVAHSAYDLGDSSSLPNFSFEVDGRCMQPGFYDALASAVVRDLLIEAGYPAARIGDLAEYANYCLALSLVVSPVYKEQTETSRMVADMVELTNCELVVSQGVLNVVPYGEAAVSGNGASWSPPAPLFDLNDDDYLAQDGEDPVRMERTRPADAYNSVRLEFLNRARDYNTDIVEAHDQAAIELYGLRGEDTTTAHVFAYQPAAAMAVDLRLARKRARNTYEFELGWRYCLLDPMDIVTLTDPDLGLDRRTVRILEMEEDDEGRLRVKVEECHGISAPTVYARQIADGYNQDFNVDPGQAVPLFLEPTAELSGALEVWAAVYGGPLWGGADVYVSTDGTTYRAVGTVQGPARVGVLTRPLPEAAGFDRSNVLTVDLSASRGVLMSGTEDDARLGNTLCWIDGPNGGEFLAYAKAQLAAAGTYQITGLSRGMEDSVATSHAAGQRFCRVDGALLRIAYEAKFVGRPLHVKFLGFNIWGGGRQTLDTVPEHVYYPTGRTLASPLPDVGGFELVYLAGRPQLVWQPVSDFRTVEYELRQGPTPQTAQILGRTTATQMACRGDGTYWLAARSESQGIVAYSSTWASLIVEGANLPLNVVASFDQAALGWPGQAHDGAAMADGKLVLSATGDILACPDILAEPDVLHYGGLAASGIYDLPPEHAVDLGRQAPCAVSATVSVRGRQLKSSILEVQDILTLQDVLGENLGAAVAARPQIATAGEDGMFGSWRDLPAGDVLARHFKFRLLLETSDPQILPEVDGLVCSVDAPDRFEERIELAVPSGGTGVTFNPAFRGGPGSSAVPQVQVTILDAQQGDDAVVSGLGLGGFMLTVKNGGAGVARSCNVFAKGY